MVDVDRFIRKVSPDSWEYQLVAAVIYSVAQRTSPPGSTLAGRWNGELLEAHLPNFLGGAHDDGSMLVSAESVLQPLRRARDVDRPLTDQEAGKVRDAMATLTHEAGHFLARLGDLDASEAYPYDDAARANAEGRVEHWTHRHLDNVIGDVFPDAGLAQHAPEVLSQPSIDAYPAYTPAARHLDQSLALRSGLTSDQVTQNLLHADDTQRWNVAVDPVIDQRLVQSGLTPEAHRATVRKELVTPLREHLAGLRAIQADEELSVAQKTDAATKAAMQAVAGLDQALNQIERRYHIQHTQRAQQQALQPSSRIQQAIRQAQQPTPLDLERLRAMTSGQRPAADATNPAAASTHSAPPDQGSQSHRERATRPPLSGRSQPQTPRRS